MRVMTVWQLMAFSLLTTPLAMAGFALVIYVPTFYAADMGLGLGLVGAVFFAGRLFDVITDPLIGHLSDQTTHRSGPRLIWIVLGLPGLLAAIWFLLAPPEGASLIYLALASAAFFLFYTIVDVPYSAIGIEISPNTHERSTIAGSKAAFQVAGAILASLIPLALAAPMGPALRAIALGAIGLGLLGLVCLLRFLPKAAARKAAPRQGFIATCRIVAQDAPFRWLAAAFFTVQAANALTAGLTVLFITHVIGAPAQIGLVFLILFAATALWLPLWLWLARRRSKGAAWRMSMLLCAALLAYVATLGTGDVVPMLVFAFVLGGVFGCDAVMPTSMLADIVARSEGKRGATYLAVKNALSKLTFLVPMGLAFPVLDLIGFQEAGPNDPDALSALVFFYAGLPIILRLFAFWLHRRGEMLHKPTA